MQTSPERILSPALLVTLLALLAWSGAVARGGFALDDREVLEGNPVIQGDLSWQAAFERDYWHHRGDAGHFRPLASLSLRADHAQHDLDPRGYHLTNVLLHAACVLAAGLAWARAAARWGTPAPWLGLAVLAAHPALADSVAWISGRTSTLSALAGALGALVLGALLLRRPATTPRLLLAAAAAALGLLGALLSKEDGLAFAPAYLLLALGSGRRALAAVGAGLGAGLLAYLSMRAAALGAPLPSAPHAPLAGEPLGLRLLVAGRALLEGLRLALLPLDHPPNYSAAPELLPGSSRWIGAVAALGWGPWLAAVGAGSLALLRRTPGRLAAAGALLGAISLLPVLQLVPAGELFAPRFLYLPLLFGVPLVDRALRSLAQRCPGRRSALCAGLLLLCATLVLDWRRAGIYADRGSYRRAVLRWNPRDARSWNDLGLHLGEEGRPAAARAAWLHAAELDPDYGRPLSNLGAAALAAGEHAAAEEALTRALELGGGNPVLQVNLANLYLQTERPRDAARHYRRATQLAPGMGAAWRGLGRAAAALGGEEEALAAFERALTLDPGDARARAWLESTAQARRR